MHSRILREWPSASLAGPDTLSSLALLCSGREVNAGLDSSSLVPTRLSLPGALLEECSFVVVVGVAVASVRAENAGIALLISLLPLSCCCAWPHRNLLQAYANSDVFFISSPDKDSYKLSVLATLSKIGSSQQTQRSSRFAVFNLSEQQPIDVTLYPTHRLSVPHLQVCPLFALLSTCQPDCERYMGAVYQRFDCDDGTLFQK